jgi:hypothetical protein
VATTIEHKMASIAGTMMKYQRKVKGVHCALPWLLKEPASALSVEVLFSLPDTESLLLLDTETFSFLFPGAKSFALLDTESFALSDTETFSLLDNRVVLVGKPGAGLDARNENALTRQVGD